jgi:hypothetical protein
MAGKFEAQVAEFARLTKEKMLLVVKQSAQDVFEIAQKPKAQGGRMPVAVGYLWNTSFVAGLNGTFTMSGGESYVLAIAGMELGDSMIGGWSAEYALRMEYGFVGEDSLGRTYNQPGNFYALNAAMEWQAIVARNVQKAQAL